MLILTLKTQNICQQATSLVNPDYYCGSMHIAKQNSVKWNYPFKKKIPVNKKKKKKGGRRKKKVKLPSLEGSHLKKLNFWHHWKFPAHQNIVVKYYMQREHLLATLRINLYRHLLRSWPRYVKLYQKIVHHYISELSSK